MFWFSYLVQMKSEPESGESKVQWDNKNQLINEEQCAESSSSLQNHEIPIYPKELSQRELQKVTVEDKEELDIMEMARHELRRTNKPKTNRQRLPPSGTAALERVFDVNNNPRDVLIKALSCKASVRRKSHPGLLQQ